MAAIPAFASRAQDFNPFLTATARLAQRGALWALVAALRPWATETGLYLSVQGSDALHVPYFLWQLFLRFSPTTRRSHEHRVYRLILCVSRFRMVSRWPEIVVIMRHWLCAPIYWSATGEFTQLLHYWTTADFVFLSFEPFVCRRFWPHSSSGRGKHRQVFHNHWPHFERGRLMNASASAHRLIF